MRGDQSAQPAEEHLDVVLQRCGHGEDGLEEHEHGQQEDGGARHRMQHHRVDPLGAFVDLRQPVSRGVQHRVDPRRHFGRIGRWRHDRRAPLSDPGHLAAQCHQSVTVSRHDRDHRHTEGPAQRADVETAVAPGQIVGERQHHADRQPGLLQLRQQPQRPAQGGGVQRDQDGVGNVDPDVVVLGVENVDDDLLVRADRVEAVGTRQVFHHHRVVLGVAGAALVARDRHTGIVAGLGMQSGQSVEQCGLPGVRASHDGEAGQPGLGDRFPGTAAVGRTGHRARSAGQISAGQISTSMHRDCVRRNAIS